MKHKNKIIAVLILIATPAFCDDLQALYNQYSQTTLLSDRYFEIKDLTIEEEALKVTFEDGKLFLTDHICDGYRGAVFIGEGAFSVKVPEVWEQVVTNRLKADVYPLTECGFEAAFFLMPPEYLGMHDFFSSGELILREADEVVVVNEESAKIKAALIEKAENILYSRIGPSDQTRLPVISFLKNHYNETPKLKPLLFDFETDDFGWLSYEYEPDERERIKLYSSVKRAVVGKVFFKDKEIASFNMKREELFDSENIDILHHKMNLETFNVMSILKVNLITGYKSAKDGTRLIEINLPKDKNGYEVITIDNIRGGDDKDLTYLHLGNRLLIDVGKLLNKSESGCLKFKYDVELRTKDQRAEILTVWGCCEKNARKEEGSPYNHYCPETTETIVMPKEMHWLPYIPEDKFTFDATIKLPKNYVAVFPGAKTVKSGTQDVLSLNEVNKFPLVFGNYKINEYKEVVPELDVFSLKKQERNAADVADTAAVCFNWLSGKNIFNEKYPFERMNLAQGFFRFVPKTKLKFCNGRWYKISLRKISGNLSIDKEDISDIKINSPGLAILLGESFERNPKLFDTLWMTVDDEILKQKIYSERQLDIHDAVSRAYLESQLYKEGYYDSWIVESLIKYISYCYFRDGMRDDEFSEFLLKNYRTETFLQSEKNDLPLRLAGYYTDDADKCYNRGTLLLHMIRSTVGADIFYSTSRRFLKENRFKNVTASMFFDILRSELDEFILNNPDEKNNFYEQQRAENVKAFLENFDAIINDWTMKPGYGKLEVSKEVIPQGKRHQLLLRISQDEESFKHMIVPVNIYKNSKKKVTLHVLLDKPDKVFEAEFPWKPKKIIIDENNTLPAKISTTEWE